MRKARRPLGRVALLLLALLPLGGCALWNAESNAPPSATVTAYPQSGPAPLTVSFEATASVGAESFLIFEWQFGDEERPEEPTVGPRCEHRFTRPGTFTARLTVIDEGGRSSTTLQQIVVLNTAPLASCRLSNDAPLPREVVRFDASGSLDLDGEIVDCAWDLGDGTVLHGVDVTHAYEEVGTYTIRLTVTDDTGAQASTTHVVLVHLGGSGGGCGGGGSVCL